MPVVKEIVKNGIRLIENENGEVLEPRFEMPIKQAFQNDRIRIVYREGYFQTILEIYMFNYEQAFLFKRAYNEDKAEIERMNWVFERFKEQYDITLQDLLPADYQEYKANFSKGKWIKPKGGEDAGSRA